MEWSGTFRQEKNIFFVPYLTRPHAIRHTFCSRCFQLGMNPKVVQKLMGHQHYSTTMDIYTHVMEDDLTEETCKMKSAI